VRVYPSTFLGRTPSLKGCTRIPHPKSYTADVTRDIIAKNNARLAKAKADRA
jgi:hypothetical protein